MKSRRVVFVTGGCKSGKSRHALELAESAGAEKKFFIATCVPEDDEMKERVRQHQEERSSHWQAVEEPIMVPEAITGLSSQADIILLDCITLWVSNILFSENSSQGVFGHLDKMVQVLKEPGPAVIIVSNEVGAGIVPENSLARKYRDIVGVVNQGIAGAATEVYWVVSGIPVKIKG